MPHQIRMGGAVASGILAEFRTETHVRGHAVSDPTRIEADYLIETTFDPRAAAEAMAGEQSSGTFVPVPGETPELKARSAARIEALDVQDAEIPQPSLPGSANPKGVADPIRRQARVTLSWPTRQYRPVAAQSCRHRCRQPVRAAAVLRPAPSRHPPARCLRGGLSRPEVRHCRDAPPRRRRDLPLIGTIIKPSVGFGPEETAALTKTLCEAGIDFIKDDELQSDGPHCPSTSGSAP